jgi:sterile alpha motif and leucine zipper-containing kinase AZK
LQCKLETTKDLDKVVLDGIAKFMDVVTVKDVSGKVGNNELVLKQRLGQGRESEVFKSRWMDLDVAVKYFRYSGSNSAEEDEDPLRSFSNEAALLMSMHHPNIISFMGFGSRPPNYFLVMEFMPKGSLFDVLGNNTIPLDQDRKKSILIDCAKGMAFLHGCRPKVIHSDLKSLNLLVGDDWTVKVADFGIAKELRTVETATKEAEDNESHGGTLQWMPPEVMLGSQEFTTKLDIFAFGVILWEVATRKRPWRGVPTATICQSVVAGQRPPIPPLAWNKPFTQLVEKCWAQDRATRPEFAKIVKMLEKLTVPI